MKLIKIEYGVAVELPTGMALPVRQIMAIGRNYSEHAGRAGAAVEEKPIMFMKNAASACLDGEEIVIPKICQDPACGGGPHGDDPRGTGQVDFEAELGVVIGQAAKDVAEGDALDHVLGYACCNDVTGRWWQKNAGGGQWNRGKGFDTFCPIGPTLVPAKELPDPQDLAIACRVNGETMQEARTGQMMFTVARLIAELSRGTTLVPGTLILTGTPAGVGVFREPKVFLQPGDTVEVEIEGIGVLKNRVREE
jgi:2-keto-4-pentenoate hydratase/2-oxohepta-3-ene-1,7-dioic acid hydratase in catechol pathway